MPHSPWGKEVQFSTERNRDLRDTEKKGFGECTRRTRPDFGLTEHAAGVLAGRCMHALPHAILVQDDKHCGNRDHCHSQTTLDRGGGSELNMMTTALTLSKYVRGGGNAHRWCWWCQCHQKCRRPEMSQTVNKTTLLKVCHTWVVGRATTKMSVENEL